MKGIGLLLFLISFVNWSFGQGNNENQTKSTHSSSTENEVFSPPPPPPPPPPPEADGFYRPDEMPRFPGCESVAKKEKKDCADSLLIDFVYSNLEYPTKAFIEKIEGIAIVQFVVLEDGSLGEVRCVRDPGHGFGDAALKVIHKMNEENIKWIPGFNKGRFIKILYTLPVRFKL